jgi:NAD(P)-dependent dehydrogenase (short-subunit alcohol dehydrogenase family)
MSGEREAKRVALVTGGARGIGLGISSALARAGFDLALCGTRDADAVREPLDELRALGADVLYLRADVGDVAGHDALLAGVRERYGRLDVLVNNAGVAPRERRDVLETTPESYDRVLGVNLRGPFFLTQRVAGWMLEQREGAPFDGCIVFITSISATVASTNRVEYCISKAGLAMAAQTWAVRLAGFGIPVYEVRPGVIRTDMTAGVTAKYDRMIEDGVMLQPRWGTPEDVGRAVAMLARGDLAYSTGQVVMVDGGMLVDRL